MMTAGLVAMMFAVIPTERNAEAVVSVVSVQMTGSAERSAPALGRARFLATQMFVGAGIELEWCDRAAKCRAWDERIVVTLQPAAPRHLAALALAEAQVFQGRDISIYLDRVPPLSSANSSSYWAHVLVHEITHLLQGCDHHAEAGVMKAYWNGRDLVDMRLAPLPFTSLDIRLIHAGVAARRGLPLPSPEAAH